MTELKLWSIDGLVPLAQRNIPEREWLVEGFIPKRSVTLMSALPNHAKSVIAFAVGHAISHGENFAGLKTQKCPVLYIDRENDGGYWKSEIMGKLFQRDEGDNFHFNLGTDEHQPPELNNLGLLAWIAGCDPKPFIIVDSLSKYLVGQNENLAQDVDPWMVQAIALRNMGCSVLVIHHMGKSGTSRGSTAIVANCDWALDLTRTEATIPTGPDKGRRGIDTVQAVVSKGRGSHQDHVFKFDYLKHCFVAGTKKATAAKDVSGLANLLQDNAGCSQSKLEQLATDAKIAAVRETRDWVADGLRDGTIRERKRGTARELYWAEDREPGGQTDLCEMPTAEDRELERQRIEDQYWAERNEQAA